MIRNKIYELKLSKRPKPTMRTEEQDIFIKENYHLGTKYCSEKLGISRSQVNGRASYLELGVPKRIVKDGYNYCPKCKKEKLIEEFCKLECDPKNCSVYCKICDKTTRRELRFKNKYRWWAQLTIQKHKQNGNIFNFTWQELEKLASVSTYCKYCGKRICWEREGKSYHDSPTLERINNDNTLDLNNIAIVCHFCNGAKKNKTLKEYDEFMDVSHPLIKELRKEIENLSIKEIDYQI